MKDNIGVGDIVEFFVSNGMKSLTRKTGLVIEVFNTLATPVREDYRHEELVVRIEMQDGSTEQRFDWQLKKVL